MGESAVLKKNKMVLVTGGAGYIGSHTNKALHLKDIKLLFMITWFMVIEKM